jgi:tRNA modification GTPase
MQAQDTTNDDTIAAIATPPGRGGVGIVRVSGAGVASIEQGLLGARLRPRVATYLPFKEASGTVIDHGLALRFIAPRSYTGEDLLELQGHGGPVVMDMLLRRVLGLGARLARPGEFTQRAFLNDKLDLTQAEAVADLIESDTEQAARAALRSLQGEFSRRVHALVDALVELRTHVEAALDFPEEEVDFLSDTRIQGQLQQLLANLEEVLEAVHQGQLLKDGMTVVIAGRPNVGKSSLLNQLAGRETAIVTSVAGTTRDVLREHIQIDGLPLHIIDTAGIHHSQDLVEQEGVKRAWSEIKRADRLLILVADDEALSSQLEHIRSEVPAGLATDTVHNKIDLTGRSPGIHATPQGNTIYLSAKTGAGMDLLREHLKGCIGYTRFSEGTIIARRRHLEALRLAREHLGKARRELEYSAAGELVAEALNLAQAALGEITGEFKSDDLLGRIFASFCIGK